MRILRSSWAVSKPNYNFTLALRRRAQQGDGKTEGSAPNDEETSACARCQVWRSSGPPLRNIRRRAKSGCDLVAMTASSLNRGSKSNTDALDTAVAIASSAAGCVDCDVGSNERTCASL